MSGIDSYVKLMLHCEGSHGGTTFIDSSSSPLTVSASGAITSTAQYKFGSSSAYFDGSNDYLYFADSSVFNLGTSDYTVDFWIYRIDTGNSYPAPLTNTPGGWGASATTIACDHSWAWNKLAVSVYDYNGGSPLLTSTSDINVTTWYHVALVRSGNTFYLFINGSLESSNTFTGNMNYNAGSGMRIGGGNWDGGNSYFYGYIDEFRFSVGIARWTTTFTPPTEAYTSDSPPNLFLYNKDSAGRIYAKELAGTDVTLDTTDFDGILSTDETDVQLALDKIDDGAIKSLGSATDNAIARWDSTSGKLIQDSPNTIITDNGSISSGADTDVTATIGRVKIGYDGSNSDIFVIKHYDANYSQAAMYSDTTGTIINGGTYVNLSVNYLSAVYITSSTIQLQKNITINAGKTIAYDGTAGSSISIARNTTSDTAGQNFTVQSGGATSGATNKNAGNLILASGVSTGTGTGSILLQTAPAGSSGTSDNAVATVATINSTGIILKERLIRPFHPFLSIGS